MKSASRRASDRPAPGSPTAAREDADSPAIRRSGPTTAASYAAWALALHGLIERSRASAPDWWEDDPAPLRAGADGELDEALPCLLLLLPLSSLVPSEPAVERAAPRAGETGPARARVPAPKLWALSRPRPCAGQRPAGVRAMPPSSPGLACWERACGPIFQATLVPDPSLSDRLVLGDIAQPAAAGPNRAGGGSGLRRETVAAFAGRRR